MKKPARTKRAKTLKVRVRVLKVSALKAFETGVSHVSSISNYSK
ncbi:hypothetical protein [Myxococcus stipitatus]